MVYYLKSDCKGSFGGCQGQPSARPWHLLIAPLGLQPFPPHRFVSLSLYTRLLPTLITISSSSIDSPVTHARLACSLPYTWAILPHIRTDPTPFRVVAGWQPAQAVSRSSIFFT